MSPRGKYQWVDLGAGVISRRVRERCRNLTRGEGHSPRRARVAEVLVVVRFWGSDGNGETVGPVPWPAMDGCSWACSL